MDKYNIDPGEEGVRLVRGKAGEEVVLKRFVRNHVRRP